jgi:hypothetical protein
MDIITAGTLQVLLAAVLISAVCCSSAVLCRPGSAARMLFETENGVEREK